MALALEEARTAGEAGDVPVGAVVARGDEVLGRSGNARERDQDPTAHAEILALRQAAGALGSWHLEGCALYVTLEPCAMCSGALVLARGDRLGFGAPGPQGRARGPGLDPRGGGGGRRGPGGGRRGPGSLLPRPAPPRLSPPAGQPAGSE